MSVVSAAIIFKTFGKHLYYFTHEYLQYPFSEDFITCSQVRHQNRRYRSHSQFPLSKHRLHTECMRLLINKISVFLKWLIPLRIIKTKHDCDFTTKSFSQSEKGIANVNCVSHMIKHSKSLYIVKFVSCCVIRPFLIGSKSWSEKPRLSRA